MDNNVPPGLSEQQMFDYALQVAKGMDYLISMKVQLIIVPDGITVQHMYCYEIITLLVISKQE